MKPVISVIGLGKLGLPMASVFASSEYKVIGIDTDSQKVNAIFNGRCPLVEPGVFVPNNLAGPIYTVTDDYEQVRKTDISFIVVNTPPKRNGELDLTDLIGACEHLALEIRDKKHIVVISSTVPPGTLDNVIRPIFKSCLAVELVSNPHFIALGKVVWDLIHPGFVLIGSDSPAGAEIENIWRSVCGYTTPSLMEVPNWGVSVVNTTPIMAEMIKFALTPYLALRIDYANMLCELCEHIPGTNVDEILKVVGLDRRLNTNELSAGLPYGGDCYPKDINAFIQFSKGIGIKPKLLKAIRDTNDEWGNSLCAVIKKKLGVSTFKGQVIAFLGISYKPGYPLLNESQPLKLAKTLWYENAEVQVYDPYIELDTPLLVSCESLESCLEDADIVIVAVPYAEFKNLRMQQLDEPYTPVVDIWRILGDTDIAKRGNWLPLGVT